MTAATALRNAPDTLRRGACPSIAAPMRTGDGLLVRLRPVAPALSAADLLALADLARRHGNGLIEITARGNLQLRGLTEAGMPQLAEGWPESARDALVMHDGVQAFRTVEDPEAEIWWGAYLGTPHEILLSGRLADMAQTITETRRRAREDHGWIMDTYLIRRPAADTGEDAS